MRLHYCSCSRPSVITLQLHYVLTLQLGMTQPCSCSPAEGQGPRSGGCLVPGHGCMRSCPGVLLQICGHGAGQAGEPSVTPGHQHRTAHCTLWTLQGLKQAVI